MLEFSISISGYMGIHMKQDRYTCFEKPPQQQLDSVRKPMIPLFIINRSHPNCILSSYSLPFSQSLPVSDHLHEPHIKPLRLSFSLLSPSPSSLFSLSFLVERRKWKKVIVTPLLHLKSPVDSTFLLLSPQATPFFEKLEPLSLLPNNHSI